MARALLPRWGTLPGRRRECGGRRSAGGRCRTVNTRCRRGIHGCAGFLGRRCVGFAGDVGGSMKLRKRDLFGHTSRQSQGDKCRRSKDTKRNDARHTNALKMSGQQFRSRHRRQANVSPGVGPARHVERRCACRFPQVPHLFPWPREPDEEPGPWAASPRRATSGMGRKERKRSPG